MFHLFYPFLCSFTMIKCKPTSLSRMLVLLLHWRVSVGRSVMWIMKGYAPRVWIGLVKEKRARQWKGVDWLRRCFILRCRVSGSYSVPFVFPADINLCRSFWCTPLCAGGAEGGKSGTDKGNEDSSQAVHPQPDQPLPPTSLPPPCHFTFRATESLTLHSDSAARSEQTRWCFWAICWCQKTQHWNRHGWMQWVQGKWAEWSAWEGNLRMIAWRVFNAASVPSGTFLVFWLPFLFFLEMWWTIKSKWHQMLESVWLPARDPAKGTCPRWGFDVVARLRVMMHKISWKVGFDWENYLEDFILIFHHRCWIWTAKPICWLARLALYKSPQTWKTQISQRIRWDFFRMVTRDREVGTEGAGPTACLFSHTRDLSP